MNNRKLEGRMESVCRSRLLVDRLNDAVSILKSKPVNGNKMYDIIYMTFLGPDKLMHEELLYRLDISARHYYRLRTQAINIIALRLWSAPAGEVDSWLEVLSILENWYGERPRLLHCFYRSGTNDTAQEHRHGSCLIMCRLFGDTVDKDRKSS